MRIKDETSKSGYFWLPENPDKRIPGTLFVEDGGDIHLEILGSFKEELESFKVMSENKGNEFKKVLGLVEKHGYVTLEDCFYTNANISFGGISKNKLYVNRAFLGAGFSEECKFNSFHFSIECLDDWIGIGGIKSTFSKDHTSINFQYDKPDEIIIPLEKGVTLKIFFAYSSTFANITENKIVQRTVFILEPEEPMTFKELTSIAHKLTTFVSLGANQVLSIKGVSVTSDEIKDDDKPIKLDVIYPSLSFSEIPPKELIIDGFFRFAHIKHNPEKYINNWLKSYDLLKPTFWLYFTIQGGAHKYQDSKFLALLQGLESYHRRVSDETMMEQSEFEKLIFQIIDGCPEENKEWLEAKLRYGNELSLSRRLGRIIKPFGHLFGNSKERSKLIKRFVDMRNYLTHFDKKLEKQFKNKMNLYPLCLKAEALIQLCFLEQIGFTGDEIDKIVNNHYGIKQKLEAGF